ncbi:hypothetical protein ACP70R_005678 [Stipagrostis hirtigluma subsp. patula]
MGNARYRSFLNETNRLPRCQTLRVYLNRNHHGFTRIMLHILRGCNSIRKLSLLFLDSYSSPTYSCLLNCTCHVPESCTIDDITLELLEEVKIEFFVGSHEELEFVKKLSRCSATTFKRLVINYDPFRASPLTKEICERIRSM